MFARSNEHLSKIAPRAIASLIFAPEKLQFKKNADPSAVLFSDIFSKSQSSNRTPKNLPSKLAPENLLRRTLQLFNDPARRQIEYERSTSFISILESWTLRGKPRKSLSPSSVFWNGDSGITPLFFAARLISRFAD
nr:hypothetical protein [Burkholderia cepacia]